MPVFLLSCVVTMAAFVLVMMCTLAFVTRKESMSMPDEHPQAPPPIPKKIWTYWEGDGDALPRSVTACIESWKRHNPDWEITIVTPNNLGVHVSDSDADFIKHTGSRLKSHDSVQFRSDMVRLHVMARNGGVWLDANCCCTQSLEWVLEYQKAKPMCEVVAFYHPGLTTDMRYPIIENWMFGCVPYANFISLWKTAFLSLILDYAGVDAYLEARRHDTDIQKLPVTNMVHYLIMYAVAQYVMQNEMNVDEIADTMYLIPSDEGPYKYLFDNNWDTEAALRSLLCNRDTTSYPLIKMRQDERRLLEESDEIYGCLLSFLGQDP
jgi:hypothetical protein